MWIARAALVFTVMGLLAGCASGPRIVASEVRTSAAQPPGAALLQAMHYRFEPLPLPPPRAGQPAPEQLQALAQTALARVGAVHDEAAARVGVQVSASVNAYWLDEWGAPYYGGPSNARIALGLGFGRGWRGGIGFGFGGPMHDASIPLYVSEVSLLMRDLQSGQIVYDTRARHDGPWHNTDAVLAALFAAALEGWPNPPPGPRRVDVPVTPQPAAASAPR